MYIDRAHAVHHNMKAHTGMYVTKGKGASMSVLVRYKLNTTSSTETEIVAVGEKLLKCVWDQHFCIKEGGSTNEDVMYQDNKSTILLMNNRIYLSRKERKHIHVRYYFITDQMKKKE